MIPLYLRKKYIDLSVPVDIDGWKRFEQLADENPSLWDIFWALSKDKKIIKKSGRCGVEYFDEALMPNLYLVMKNMWTNDNLDFEDLQIILSLFVQMIPKGQCENCDCETKTAIQYDDIRKD